MSESRLNLRYQTFARVKIKEIDNDAFPLKDLSVTGCRVECPSGTEIMPDKQFTVEIIPETASKIDSFFLTVESKWIRVSGDISETGFLIVESPKGKQFQRYVDYLSWRYAQGKSMTGESSSSASK